MALPKDCETLSPEGNHGKRSQCVVNICQNANNLVQVENNEKCQSYEVEVVQENKRKQKKTKQKRKKYKQWYCTFGDHLVDKEDHVCMIVSQNFNCIRVSLVDNYKQEKAKDCLINHDVDVVGWQETGVAFHRPPKRERLLERMKDPRWTKIRMSSCNNKHEIVETFQYGGTSIMAFN